MSTAPAGSTRTWLSTLPAMFLLAFLVVHWTATQVSGRIVQAGGWLWEGYAAELRSDLAPPEPPSVEAPTDRTGADEGLIQDLLGDAAPPADPGAADQALIDDLLGDEAPAAGTPDQALVDDLLGHAAAPAAGEGTTAAAVQEAYTRKKAAWDTLQTRLTPAVRAFRSVDLAVAAFTVWGGGLFRHLLVLLIAVGGVTASATRGHIALGTVHTTTDARVSSGFLLVANLLVAASQIALYGNEQASGTEIQDPLLPLGWAAAFLAMAAVDVVFLLRPHGGLPGFGAPPIRDGGTWKGALPTIPLYAWMAILCSIWFLGFERYPSGMAIYFQSLTEHAQLYLMVGLYVWTGMLLKQTSFAPQTFAVLRPWRLAPELLAIVLVILSAFPTAYSGASGIFVMAAGVLIYRELISVGGRPQLALASTAMAGSLGVVLRPCLLPVIVAYLNPVTTDTLYGAGIWVYLLTAVLFVIVVLVTRTNRLTVAPASEALPASWRALKPVALYLAVALVVLLAYRFGLDASIDEHTAPLVLPVVLLGMILLERLHGTGARAAVPAATSEATHHIGALLLLMALSIAVGGVFERAEIMALVPTEFDSPIAAMAVLVVIMVVVGMTMDPYGAVILVSATIADVAYKSGIEPGHFWMMVLCAFELGYLTPPVALNHLLARQVVGEAYDEHTERNHSSWWYRHERLALPLTVMGIALLVVAFGPLLV